MQGGADFLMIADPTTFRVLPWAPKTGWVLCDIYFQDGTPVPFSTRHLYRKVLRELADAGYDYMAGLEVEFHVFKLDESAARARADATWPGEAPEVSLLSPGYQYLTETRFDQIEPMLETRAPRRGRARAAAALGRDRARPEPVRVHVPSAGRARARRHHDAVPQRREAELPPAGLSRELHVPAEAAQRDVERLASASVAARPARSAPMRSWRRPRRLLSPLGRHFLGGLLAHARAAAAFTTPTINGYKRYRAYALAPDRVIWGHDNRGVMVRVIGGPGDPATRLENRVGEPAANPYLYMASQIVAGLDGIARKLDPGPSADTPYETEGAAAAEEPRRSARGAARGSPASPTGFGQEFVDYYLHHQGGRDRALPVGGHRVGAEGIFRAVLMRARQTVAGLRCAPPGYNARHNRQRRETLE